MQALQDLAEVTMRASSGPPTPVSELRTRIRRRRQRSLVVGALGLGLVGALVVGAVVLRADDDAPVRVAVGGMQRRPVATIPDLPPGIPQPSTAKRARAHLGQRYAHALVRGDTIWAIATGRLVAIDATSLQRRRGSVALRDRYVAVGVAASADSVWVLSQRFDGSPYVVTQVDPSSLEVRREIELPGPGAFGATEEYAIIATPEAAWIGVGSLFRVDAASGAVSSYLLPHRPEWMSANRDSLWMLFADAQVLRFDFGTNQIVQSLSVSDVVFPWSLAVDDEAVWVTGNHLVAPGEVAQHLVRIDPDTYETRTFDLPAIQVATGDGEVWVQLYDSQYGVLNENGLVGQVDPATGRIKRTLRTPLRSPPSNGPSFTIEDGRIWVGGLVRITP